MSARSAIESTPDSAARRDVVRAVGAARRRLRTVAMLRLMAIAAPAGVTVGAALTLAGLAPAWTAGALGALGLATAGAWAVARTPLPAAVARLLDARLGLRDRVAAAVQLHESDGPIAALVTRDAAARLASVRLASVFPLALNRPSAVSLALAGVSLAWLASSSVTSERTPAPARAMTGEAAAAEAGARGREDSRDGARAGAATASPPAAGQLTASRGAMPGAAERRDSSTREAFAPEAAARDPRATEPGTEARGSAAAAPGASSPGTPPAAAANASGRSARGGAGAGATPNGGLAAGAGGAVPGNALAATSASASAPPLVVLSGTARANAEAALARDVIPPDYRDHVRAYFRTLPSPYTGAGGTR